MQENTKDLMVDVKEEAEQVSKTVCWFLTEDLQKDVPTGLTPARVERSYPRVLAATSPQQTILARSVHSSHPENPANLSCFPQVPGPGRAGRRLQVVPGRRGRLWPLSVLCRTPSVFRTPSSSRSGSRASSRQNSSTELKHQGRSVSTSDFGSEIGDSENQDPNFRCTYFGV